MIQLIDAYLPVGWKELNLIPLISTIRSTWEAIQSSNGAFLHWKLTLMMMSWHGNSCHFIGSLCKESTSLAQVDYSPHTKGQSQGGVLWKIFDGCTTPVFDCIPLAKEILAENILLAKENFLIMSPFLRDFKEFQPKYSLLKRNFPKTNANLAPICPFLGVFVKNISLAKDFRRKIYPWLRIFCQKYTLGLGIWSQKVTLGSGTPPLRSTWQ